MSVLSQSTISNKISFSGIGIHTGKKVKMNILPHLQTQELVFKRID